MLRKIGLVIFAPAKLINSVAKKIRSSETVEAIIGAILSFLVMIVILTNFWPIHNGWEFLLVFAVSLVSICIAVGLASTLLSIVTGIIIYATNCMTKIYDKCSVSKIYQESGESIKINQKPEVTLQYFIAKESKAKMCYAKYLR